MAFDLSSHKITELNREYPVKHNAFVDAVEAAGNALATETAIAAEEIDWTDSDSQSKTINGNTEFTFTGANTSYVNNLALLLTMGGSYTVDWPAAVKWPYDTEPAWISGRTYRISLEYWPSEEVYLASWLEYTL